MKQERKTVTAGPMILKIKLEDIPNIFFTSDLHLSHANILKYCNRPCKNVEEMNKILLDNLNATISNNPNAILINCGDVMFGNLSMYDEYMNSINAKKIYNIIGNHDLKNILQRRDILPYNENERVFWSTELIVQLYGENNKLHTTFTVSHYPHCAGQFMGAFNIHGHLHTPKDVETYTGSDANTAKKLKEQQLCYDVGVDGNDYKPVKLTDILTGNLIMYQIKSIDHNAWKERLKNI